MRHSGFLLVVLVAVGPAEAQSSCSSDGEYCSLNRVCNRGDTFLNKECTLSGFSGSCCRKPIVRCGPGEACQRNCDRDQVPQVAGRRCTGDDGFPGVCCLRRPPLQHCNAGEYCKNSRTGSCPGLIDYDNPWPCQLSNGRSEGICCPFAPCPTNTECVFHEHCGSNTAFPYKECHLSGSSVNGVCCNKDNPVYPPCSPGRHCVPDGNCNQIDLSITPPCQLGDGGEGVCCNFAPCPQGQDCQFHENCGDNPFSGQQCNLAGSNVIGVCCNKSPQYCEPGTRCVSQSACRQTDFSLPLPCTRPNGRPGICCDEVYLESKCNGGQECVPRQSCDDRRIPLQTCTDHGGDEVCCNNVIYN